MRPIYSDQQIVPNLNPQGNTVPETSTKNEPISSKEQKLRELKQLLDEKLINLRDYERQKKSILNEK